ncbi:tartrate-resistant acid phosphatase type 5a [Lepisosteus oculatus]|uniref:tartrate-resistant acid phosphatase type 5a n=1 Tax=Lepisosteus oculatus TaxID=7918 RepID=UPI0035F5036F
MAAPLLLLSAMLSALPMVLCFPSPYMDHDHHDPNRTSASIRFLVVGDWGGLPNPPYMTPIEKATAHEMGKAAKHMGADFILAVGDNFYYRGVNSVRDPRFQETFERVFTAESLEHTPWYVIAGNHDHLGNVEAQIEYSRHSKRWNFRYYYYDLHFRVPHSDATLTILMLDTILLCGNSHDYLDERPRGASDSLMANQQLQWLAKQLETSRADFLLVAGHYPVWSVSDHGPTECLLDNVRPLLLKYNATAYLCGHDHNLQYLEESGVGYVVSGAGNFLDNSMKHKKSVPAHSLKFFYGQQSSLGGFAHVEVTKKDMTITFIQARGKSLYRTVLPRRTAP